MELAKNCTVSPIKANSSTLWNPTCSLLSSGNGNNYRCQQPLNKTVLWLLCFFAHIIDLTRKMGNICGLLPSTFPEAKGMNMSLPPGLWRTQNPRSLFLWWVPRPWNHFNQFLKSLLMDFSRSHQFLKQLTGLSDLSPVPVFPIPPLQSHHVLPPSVVFVNCFIWLQLIFQCVPKRREREKESRWTLRLSQHHVSLLSYAVVD